MLALLGEARYLPLHLDGIFDIQFEDFSGTSLAKARLVTNPCPHLFTKENPSFDVHDVTEGWDILDVYISTIKGRKPKPLSF